MNESRTWSVVIVGAGGYAGRELVRMLVRHPRVRLAGLFGSDRQSQDKPSSIADLHPSLTGECHLPVLPASVAAIQALRPDVVFLATPHEASLDLAVSLQTGDAPPVVLDLSAAYRFTSQSRDARAKQSLTGSSLASLYPKHYGFEHHHAAWLDRAVYGLAELHADKIAQANLIAVPGCYPTSAILPLAPLVQAGAIDLDHRVIIDAVSGVSGAGRTPTAKTHFCEVSLQAYNVLKHRHQPEIDLHSGLGLGGAVFTPHLVEFDRGILSTIHAELMPGWTAARVGETLTQAYRDKPFVRLLGLDRWPAVASVRLTNYADVGWAVDEVRPESAAGTRRRSHLILGCAIDNLVKGAAGQAIQCMNIRLGLPETTSLGGAIR